MALFIRACKTSIWSEIGKMSFKRFIADKNQEAFTVTMTDDKGKTHSITMYGTEIEKLKEALK